MKLLWQIELADIDSVKAFYEKHRHNNFVINRHRKNVQKIRPQFSKERFWHAMLSCRLTTQQKSGPNSSVTRFISTKPFPLDYDICKNAKDAEQLVARVLTKFGGIRFAKTVAKETLLNLHWLEKESGWNEIEEIVYILSVGQTPQSERASAEKIMESLHGFGPKQSRNLLQALGLTIYEIPIDSRITKWLMNNRFPKQLLRSKQNALSDKNYYNFILDGVQELCKAAGIYPCLLDAAIFSSYDEEWPEERNVLS